MCVTISEAMILSRLSGSIRRMIFLGDIWVVMISLNCAVKSFRYDQLVQCMKNNSTELKEA